MKQMKFYFITLLCLLMANVAMADDESIPVEQLPSAAKAFVYTHFKDKKITQAEKDGSAYECRLDDGTKIEFDRKGNWDNVECESRTSVPQGIVPQSIQRYVKTKYAGNTIKKIDKERYGYEVELSNDIELKFNKKGRFIGIDR